MAKVNKRDLPRWQLADYRADRCELHEIGELIPQEDAPDMTFHPPMDPIPEESIAEMLKKAYYSIGGDKSLAEWAKKNPTEFYKLMLRREAKDATINTAPSIVINLGGSLGRLVEAQRDLLGDK
jgi:hypothetical protein